MSTDVPSAANDVDIVVLGALMADLTGTAPQAALESVETFRRTLGDASSNVATTAARLGRRVAIIARVGHDAFGRYVRTALRQRQILDHWLQIDPKETTTLAFFAESSNTRNFLVIRGADRYLTLDEETRSLIRRASALHTTTFSLSLEPSQRATVEAIELAHAAGHLVSLDPNYRADVWHNPGSFMPLLHHLLPLTTVIKPSLKDAAEIWGVGQSPGDYVARFHEHGARQVLLTLGRDGVIASDGQTIQRLPAVPIEATDTVGAGDAFTAGALAALLDGHDLFTAARVGMVVASYKLRAPEYSGPLPRMAVLVEQAFAGEEDAPPVQRNLTPRKR
jgi:sugar/nucleoside kinase (ribokinase family)